MEPMTGPRAARILKGNADLLPIVLDAICDRLELWARRRRFGCGHEMRDAANFWLALFTEGKEEAARELLDEMIR